MEDGRYFHLFILHTEYGLTTKFSAEVGMLDWEYEELADKIGTKQSTLFYCVGKASQFGNINNTWCQERFVFKFGDKFI